MACSTVGLELAMCRHKPPPCPSPPGPGLLQPLPPPSQLSLLLLLPTQRQILKSKKCRQKCLHVACQEQAEAQLLNMWRTSAASASALAFAASASACAAAAASASPLAAAFTARHRSQARRKITTFGAFPLHRSLAYLICSLLCLLCCLLSLLCFLLFLCCFCLCLITKQTE